MIVIESYRMKVIERSISTYMRKKLCHSNAYIVYIIMLLRISLLQRVFRLEL